ncbi:MAG: AAA family ATPase, partial [Candidatus Bathyarchaeia archaeon]
MTISREAHARERFLEFFKTNECRRLIKQMALTGKRSTVLDFMQLTLADSDLANKLYAQPDVYLEYAEDALLEQLQTEDRDYSERLKGKKLNVRLKSLPEKTLLREISADNVEKLVSFDALVVRAGSVKPLITRAAWVCREGHANFETQKDRILLRRPERCNDPGCRSDTFEIRPENSDYVNYQELRVQERPEDLPPGQLPRYLEAYAMDDIVDVARPGDRVIVTGIVRARPEVIPGKGLLLRLFNISVEVNHLETLAKEIETVDISPDDEKKIKEIAKKEFIHRDIVNSIAPSIYGNEDIKEAVMYLLFSGVSKTTSEGISIRGDIHTLIVGDPGTAKSQMLRYVAKVSPRGLYTSGRGTTAAGLTAAVVREKTGGMALEAGALVLADKGIAAVDEIDKMRDEDRIAMHEMMEQQTVSIAKGGIIATLNARSSIIAAANPKLGRYEDRLPVTENINIPIVILSRFDLIFIEKDRPQKSMDERLSEHILNVHRDSATFGTVPIESDLLRKYIAYARSRVQPKLTDEAMKRL